jgi:hypothetical protein
MPHETFDPMDWDGDPETLPTDVIRRLTHDEDLAERVFANHCEAFNSGLALASQRQPVEQLDRPQTR